MRYVTRFVEALKECVCIDSFQFVLSIVRIPGRKIVSFSDLTKTECLSISSLLSVKFDRLSGLQRSFGVKNDTLEEEASKLLKW